MYRVVDHGPFREFVRIGRENVSRETLLGQVAGTKRGCIDGMTWDSRKRLLAKCFSLDWRGAVLLTLTARESPDYDDLRGLWKRLRRAKEGISMLWVMELQKRGAVHYHAVIFGAGGFLLPQAEIQRMWGQVLGVDLAIVDVRKCDARGALYIAKYVSKGGAGGASLDNMGISGRRWWGVMGARDLPVLDGYDEKGVVVDVVTAETRWKTPGVASMVLTV